MVDDKKQTYNEYIERKDAEPLLQGDVFLWEEKSDDPWKQFGIIVTADCDLANNKFGDSMSYCPILRLHDFLKLFWVNKDLLKQQEVQAKSIAEQLTRIRKINRPEFTESVDGKLLPTWLELRGAGGILDDIKEPPGKQRQNIENQLDLLQHLINVTTADSLQEQIIALAKSKIPSAPTLPTEEKINASALRLWNEYSSKVPNLQGDLFFLSELSPNHKDGYIVYLRRISEISPATIAIDMRKREAKALRISHLRSVLKYRITQKLAAVFSDIGLPTNYENKCRETMAITGLSFNINTL